MNVDFLRDVALAVAQEQHLETVMKMIVEGINEEPDVALVRLWILESEDNSTECHPGGSKPNPLLAFGRQCRTPTKRT
jgi:hypothetical protein